MKKCLLLLLFSYCFYFPLVGQDELTDEATDPIKYPIFIGLTGQMLIPQSSFGKKMNQPGYGGQLEFLVNLNQSPFYAGFASSIANFGNEVFKFTDAGGFDLKWKTNSSLWSSHFTLHFEPPMQSKVQPYVSGQLGFNHFFTVSRLVDPELDENRTLERYVDDKSWGFSYGGSLGLLIPLDKKWRTMLDFRATYLRGTDSSYYTKKQESYTINEDSLEAFDLESSLIEMVGVQIGILVFIN